MRYIQDDIGAVVAAMRDYDAIKPADRLVPFYLYGKRKYINGILCSKDLDIKAKYQKYPLIALFFDIAETVGTQGVSYKLTLVIAALTKQEYTVEDRYAKVIKPILVPLYERFFVELKKSGLFMWKNEQGFEGKPKHVRIVRPLWGTQGAEENEKYVFSDPLDAIEIRDLEINSTNKKC